MKFEAVDQKKGLSVQELREVADRLEGLVHSMGQNPNDVYVKAWVNMKAGIKSLEV